MERSLLAFEEFTLRGCQSYVLKYTNKWKLSVMELDRVSVRVPSADPLRGLVTLRVVSREGLQLLLTPDVSDPPHSWCHWSIPPYGICFCGVSPYCTPSPKEQVLVLPWGGSADWQSGGSVRGHQGEVTVEIMFLFCVSLFISSFLLICICEHREHLLIEV